MSSDEALSRANQRLQAQALELAEQKLALQALQDEVQRLRTLATISGDWYWAQDAQYRFVEFSTEQDNGKLDDAALDGAMGNCRWDLPGIVPLQVTWEMHRAVLDARKPFRDLEYMRLMPGGLPRYFSVTGMPLFDSNGQFTGYRGTTRDITTSKRAEEAQREASRFLDNIVDNIPIAVHLKSVHGGRPVVVWNRAAEALYGLGRQDTIGRTVYDLWPKAEADIMHAADLEVLRSGAQDFPDRLVPTKHRGAIHVHMHKAPLRDATGEVTHILIIAEDITERIATEASLRHSQQRFRSLTELSSDWYWEVDEQFRFTLLSGGSTEEIQNRITPFLGKARWEIGRTTADPTVWAAHRAQLEKHETFRDFEYEREDEEGKRVLCISGEPIFDGSGKFTGYRGVGTDITARKSAETALRASEARFRTVVAVLAEGILLRDAAGRIVDCNASAERILGRTLVQMKGETRVDAGWEMLREDGSLMPDEERPITVALRTGLPQSNVVLCYRRPDRSTLWILLNLQPLFEGDHAQPSGFVTTLTDITKRKKAETEIVRLNVDLENRVSRRTAQLEAANKELEAFSYSVAHDLRSPLSAIDGYCVLLNKTVAPGAGERARHYLNRIRSGVQRMGELTDGLLSLAQLSRTSLSWSAVDMSEEAAKIIQRWTESDSSRVAKVTIEGAMVVRADGSLLRQVLENLIANAWKFSSKKPVTEISIGKETGADRQAVYFVRDNGAGFDMAYADKLFGTFQRLHSPEEFSGSGIGLATVQRIITRHGGRIWANSKVDEGSTFYFTIGSDGGIAAPELNQRDESGIALARAPRSRHLFTETADPYEDGGNSGSDRPISTDNDAFAVNDQQFSNAFEHAAIGMALIAVDSRRLRVNSAFCKMLGYSEAEMMSRTIQDITHPDDIEWDLRQRERALAGEIETYQWEKRYIHRSGAVVWGHLSCSLVRDTDRKPLHFIMQVQDITERRETEKILRESEERFRTLTALASDWFWEQDENFRFVQVSGNSEVAPIVVGSSVQAIGKTPWELDHVTMDEKLWDAHRAQLVRHEVFRDFEVIRRDREGNVRYVTISGVPIFNAEGRFTGYRGTGRDTTEMRRVNEALRVSEAQLRDIIDTLPAIISYVDASQRFRFHNRAYAEGLGLSSEQIDGRTMPEVLGEEGYELARPWVEEVLSGYPVTFERNRKTPQGEFRDFIVKYFPRYGDGAEEGRVVGFYALGTDVTELKRFDRMKSEFVSAVGEELRTPLTSIRESLSMISGHVAGGFSGPAKELIATANSHCQRLIRLINDILDIEKMESGKMQLELEPVELRPLLLQLCATHKSQGAARNIDLKLDFPVEDVCVRADRDRLSQVMNNLLSNAIKFSADGAPVTVRVVAGGAGVRVEVQDQGSGIPEELRKRIFQKFSQAELSGMRAKGGTGLGLNLSRALVEKMGGTVGFETHAKTGTTFYLELPPCTKKPAPRL